LGVRRYRKRHDLIVIVRFPIQNTVRIDDPWPIKVGSKTFFMNVENGSATAVGVRFTGVPTDAAPKFERLKDGPVKARIVDPGDRFALAAEYDLRAWQTLLMAYILVDIDFDSPKTEFKPETQDEEGLINIHSFSTKKFEMHRRGTEEFALYGRAFLALDLGRPLIELMSLYRDALKALFAGRYIDAYNNFYLFLETQFCRGRTATNQASTELVKNTEFMSALHTVVGRTADDESFKKLRFKSLEKWKDDPRSLVKEIVELRGLLRHHSLNSPHRWDPNRQENYEIEARFLSIVAYEIAFPKITGKLWDSPYPEEFSKMANEKHMSIHYSR
jgi:hypothetical protein